MVKILQINVVVNTGSTGRIINDIGNEILKFGWSSYIAYGRTFSGHCVSTSFQIGTYWDTLIHVMQTRLLDRHGLGSVVATNKLISWIKSIQPDIIHLHNIHGYYVNYVLLFEYLSTCNIPIVWTLHDCWSFTGHCAYFDFVKCSKWKLECGTCPQISSYPASFIIDRSNSNFLLKKRLFATVPNLTIVTVSNWLANKVRCSYLNNYPIEVIPNGIDTKLFNIIPTSKIQDHADSLFTILGVASVWEPRKGLDDFIKLAKIIPDDCRIVLLGLSKKQIRMLPPNILGIKRTESIYELAKLYSSADLFINPTLEDNFPTTNLEALACGTPVATYRTGGSVEAVNLETGFIVECGDIDGLLTVINTVKRNGKAFYSSACRERAANFFNIEDRYVDYIRLYEKILLNIK